jgi:short-subunit dehydrogenase
LSRFRLTDKYPQKRAFITGAGSGLGLAFARALAADGWSLGITDINEQSLDASAATLRTIGGSAVPYVFDVANYADFQKAVKDFTERNGGIDIGINNAGIGCGGLLDEVSIEEFRKTIETNLMGVANGCHLFVPIMKKQDRGYILNVASAAAFLTAPRMSAYSASKAGVVALSECIRGELADSNIVVSILAPSYVRTNIGKETIGAENDKKYSCMLVDESRISAEEVAHDALKLMANGNLYIMLPRKARILWRLKRTMPEKYWRLVKKAAESEVERLSAKIITSDKP